MHRRPPAGVIVGLTAACPDNSKPAQAGYETPPVKAPTDWDADSTAQSPRSTEDVQESASIGPNKRKKTQGAAISSTI